MCGGTDSWVGGGGGAQTPGGVWGAELLSDCGGAGPGVGGQGLMCVGGVHVRDVCACVHAHGVYGLCMRVMCIFVVRVHVFVGRPRGRGMRACAHASVHAVMSELHPHFPPPLPPPPPPCPADAVCGLHHRGPPVHQQVGGRGVVEGWPRGGRGVVEGWSRGEAGRRGSA